MKRTIVTAAAAALLAAAGVSGAHAAPVGPRNPLLIDASVHFYFWSGHRYCWYPDGWDGPGWYWCGYPWRDGLGWGGPFGWNGWVGGFPGHRHDHDRWRRDHDRDGGRDHDRGDHGSGARSPMGSSDALDDVRAGFAEEG